MCTKRLMVFAGVHDFECLFGAGSAREESDTDLHRNLPSCDLFFIPILADASKIRLASDSKNFPPGAGCERSAYRSAPPRPEAFILALRDRS